MQLIVGLGNPGPAYQHTRHNAGFMLVDRLAKREDGGRFRKGPGRSRVCRLRLGDHGVTLAKPQTFMNLSGEAVRELLSYYRLDPTDLLVVYDEVALPLGRIRIRQSGSAGGHKGMKSIISCLGTQEFARLRIGIGPAEPPHDLSDYVLGEFTQAEMEVLSPALDQAVDAVRVFLQEGPEEAMARFN